MEGGGGGWMGQGLEHGKKKKFSGSFGPIQKNPSLALQVSLAKMIIQFAHPSSEEPDGVLSTAALLEG